MSEELSWNTLCARAKALVGTGSLGGDFATIEFVSLRRRVLIAMKELPPFLYEQLNTFVLRRQPVRIIRTYPPEVLGQNAAFLLLLNHELPKPFCAWDISDEQPGCYEVSWQVPMSDSLKN